MKALEPTTLVERGKHVCAGAMPVCAETITTGQSMVFVPGIELSLNDAARALGTSIMKLATTSVANAYEYIFFILMFFILIIKTNNFFGVSSDRLHHLNF